MPMSECPTCEGAGFLDTGFFGSYYRDGEKYDPPSIATCDICNGTGQVQTKEKPMPTITAQDIMKLLQMLERGVWNRSNSETNLYTSGVCKGFSDATIMVKLWAAPFVGEKKEQAK